MAFLSMAACSSAPMGVRFTTKLPCDASWLKLPNALLRSYREFDPTAVRAA